MKRPFLYRAAPALAATALALLAVRPAAAQSGQSISIHGADSVSFIVQRHAPTNRESAVHTTDGKVELVLRDSVVVMQLTDYGMDHLFDAESDSARASDGVVAGMLRASMKSLFDHGIAYRVSALRDAYAEGSRLVLEDRTGAHVFETTKYNGHVPLQELDAREAARFAAQVKRAIPIQ